MKTIILEANGTTLTVLSSENLVSGSNRNILKVKFSEDWEGYDKTALFTLYDISGGSILYKDNYESIFDNPYSELPNPLIPNNGEYICIIPLQFTSEPGTLSINIVGTRPIIDPEPEKACTNEAIINVEKGASVSDGELGQPSEGLYAQVLALANKAADDSGTANANAKYAYNAAKEVLDAKNNGELDGKDGEDGKTPYIGKNGNWFIDSTDTGVKADITEDLEALNKQLNDVETQLGITTETLETVISDIGVIDESILPNLPKDVNGEIIEAASKKSLNESVEEITKSIEEVDKKLPKIYYNTINDKEFIKNSIKYKENEVSDSTYVCIYDRRTEDGTATFGDAPCKSGILFHYQTMSNVIIQTLYGNDSRVYQRIFFTDMGTFGAWNDTWETVETLEEEVSTIAEALPTEKNGDYKEVAAKEDVDNLSTKLIASTLKGSASGSIVSMKDVSPIEHEMGVKARGKNLIPNPYPEITSNTTEIDGVTINVNEGGTITINGTATADVALKCYSWNAVSLKAGTYTFSGGISQNVRVSFSGKTAQGAKLFDFTVQNTPTTQQLTKDMTQLYMVVRVTKGTVCENVTVRPMIEEGSTATAYAPYVPDITQAKILKQGKNFFCLNETKTRTAGGLSFDLKQGQSSFIVSGTSTASSSAKLTEIPLKAGTYTVAIYGANAITTDMDRIFLQYTTNGSTATINNIMDGKTKTFTLSNDATVRIEFVFAAESTYSNKEIRIQIEEGSTATDYEPYIAPTEHSIMADGTVPHVTSIHPATTLCADTDGVIIDVDYNRDINIAFKNLEDKITALSAAMI